MVTVVSTATAHFFSALTTKIFLTKSFQYTLKLPK